MRWIDISVFSIVISVGLGPVPALAQQPLAEFLAAADDYALDVREAEAALSQARSQSDEARARLLPNFLGSGGYQRNDPEIILNIPIGIDPTTMMPITRQAAITPADQLLANFQLAVPLIDLAGWAGFFQSEAIADSSSAQLDATRQNVHVAVVQVWYQLVGMRALVGASERNVDLAEQNRDAASARVEVGVAPELERARAEAELSRAREALAAAQLQSTLAARNLRNLTNVVADDRETALDDDLRVETAIEQYLDHASELPFVRVARHQQRAAAIARDGAWLALLPTISAVANARFTNATGFGRSDTYYVGVSATWFLDFARPARISTQEAILEGSSVRSERAVQQTETAIFEAWHRVESARARVEAANVGLDASQRASDDAQVRFDSGAGTQLELIQAQRDLFQAAVLRIQAIADLKVARAVLRIRSGMDVDR